jgi:hypothetical protein
MKKEDRVKLMDLLDQVEADPSTLPYSELEDAQLLYKAAYYINRDTQRDFYLALMKRARFHAEAAFSIFVREDLLRARDIHDLLAAIDSELNPTEEE